MEGDTTKTDGAASGAESNPLSSTPGAREVAPVMAAPAPPNAPKPGAVLAPSTAQPSPSAPPAPLSALPPLPGPIYAPIPPRAPVPPPSPAQSPSPQPPAPAWQKPATPAPRPSADESIVCATQPATPAPGAPPSPLAPTLASLAPATVTGADVGLKTNITKILEEARMPERRDMVAATQNPSLQTALTDAPYRASAQLDAAPPTTDVPSALELSIEQNKLAAPPETQAPVTGLSSVVSLHTMKSDLQSVVRKDSISLVRAASMEADKRPGKLPEKAAAPGAPKRWRSALLIVSATLVLFGLGGAALYAVYYLKTTKPSAAASAARLLFAEQQIALPIDAQSSAAIKQNIQSIMTGQGAPSNSIIEVWPIIPSIDEAQAPRAATFAEFLRALGARPSEEFIRSLSEEFFFGIHFADAPSPLFVVPVVSYDHAFAGMLAWEKSINTEFGGLFVQLPPYRTVLVPAIVSATSTSATSTEATSTPRMVETQEPVPPRAFEDLVMRNYDVRALKDDNGNIVLYYSFPTQDLLVISASPYTFPEVLSRLQAARKL